VHVYGTPSTVATDAVPLAEQYVKFLATNVKYTGAMNWTMMLLLSPAYVAVILTLPALVPERSLIATPFTLVVVREGETENAVLLTVKFTVPPFNGYPKSSTVALSWSSAPLAD